MVRSLLWAGIVAAGIGSTDAMGGDWPQWLGPTRNGVTDEVVPAWKSPPEVVWKKDVGNGFGSPIVAGGVAYIHTAVAGQEAEAVVAFDAVTGEEKWRDQ